MHFAAALIWAYANAKLAGRQFAIGLTVLLAIDLWTIERMYWIFGPPASQLFATDPAAEAIKTDIAKTGEPGRVVNIPMGSGIVTELGRTDRTFSGDKLMAAGLRIPGDISVVGYDDDELSRHLRPQLTTLELPHRPMGAWAIEQLARKTRPAPRGPHKVGCTFVARGSIGRKPT